MTARDFCFWLQGYFEVGCIQSGSGCALTNEQVKIIQRHLALVFAHDIDPKAGGPEVQDKLNAIHGEGAAWRDKNTVMRC